jgi:hypothetical protein
MVPFVGPLSTAIISESLVWLYAANFAFVDTSLVKELSPSVPVVVKTLSLYLNILALSFLAFMSRIQEPDPLSGERSIMT